MGTFCWLLATTLIGYHINHIWFLESADWIGALIGFGLGVLMRLMISGGSSGISDSISSFDDFGSDSD